jgi:hypothetical protein
MTRRDWCFEIGPLDEEQAHALRDTLERQIDDSLDVDLVDDRVWLSRAWDASTVRAVTQLLEAGLASDRLASGAKQIGLGVLDDMRDWLNREYDSSLDAMPASDSPDD